MECIHLVMIREELWNLPLFPLPKGYRFRFFQQGDAPLWAAVETAAGEFRNIASALAHFEEEFGPYSDELERRCLFLTEASGRVIGTASAWFQENFQGREFGRLHWVAIHPEFQGRGLCKPLVSQALARLAELHARAYLTTQTTSWKAIRVYLDCGFRPLLESPRCEDGWRLMAEYLRHPALAAWLPRG